LVIILYLFDCRDSRQGANWGRSPISRRRLLLTFRFDSGTASWPRWPRVWQLITAEILHSSSFIWRLRSRPCRKTPTRSACRLCPGKRRFRCRA
jgi:hypothetical protein